MNMTSRATRAAGLINSNPFQLRAASLFHSTPILERRRRNQWDNGNSANRGSQRTFNYSRRSRKSYAKQQLLHNVGAFAEHLFQSWQHGEDEYDPSSSRGSSWFREDFRTKRSSGGWSRSRGGQSRSRGDFQFCDEDDVECEKIFQAAFGGGTRTFFWSFVNEEPRQWRDSSRFYYERRYSWRQKFQYEDDYDSSVESDYSEEELTSDRLALGLTASGPLSLEDVKNAYRACALKWHPDRHQGSSKVVAEEKFKICSAAYQSLCDKLALT